MKFRFIQEHLQEFPTNSACDVLQVSRAGYYAWRERPAGERASRRQALCQKIELVYRTNRRVYGSPRVCRALKAAGERVCENTVAKVMRQEGIRAKNKKEFVPRTPTASMTSRWRKTS